ncbi:MAG TPA: glycoside hydrolase family 44 protein [Bryobacteraceae bacterium]|nr:glycoside hydrolase family 44 protein [Bryobacteraceae bacterium]
MLSERVVLALILLGAAHCFAQNGFAQNPATTVNVDANANRHAINPNIYGIAYGDAQDMSTLNAPLNRWGGNATSRYNWQIDAHSAGSDWYFETYSDGSGTPSGSADAYVATTRANAGAEPLFTIPMIDYLANLGANRTTLEGFSVKKYGAQTATDPWNSDAGNGVSAATGKNITGNNPLDTGVANSTSIQQAWVQHFVSTFGSAATSSGIKYYLLDNEPSLWYQTHRDVHPDPSTYQEMYDKIVAYASAIRAADPNAKIVGPEEWSWWAMWYSGFDQANGWSAANSDYNTHGQMYYYPWLLQQLYAYQQQTGTKLLDVLSVHCYNGAPASSDDSASGQQYRNAETRILWDPNYQDPSWYGDIAINGRVINWIPTLKAMVSQYYPGLEVGCTEYNWGDEPNLNGATTQADVLGIYGREGLDLATRWTVAENTGTTPTTYYVTYLASQIYRNYDGNNSTFGDTSVEAGVADPDNLSAFASVRSSDGALTVMVINKQQGSTPVTVSLANFSSGLTAQVWQINSASQTSIAQLANASVANNSISTTVPSQSITLFVIPQGGTVSAPGAPTGLAATPANGSVTLTWNATGGATSYTVKRGTAHGGPYTALATVGSSPTSYTDSGLTNGTTYYYVVTGTNSAGTSPNSAEVSATPAAPATLTFQSSATASPATFAPGASTTIAVSVTDTGTGGLSNAIVELQVFDKSGNAAMTTYWTGQNFAAGQTLKFSYTWNSAASLASGTYSVDTGVFDSTWATNYYWNGSAASITIAKAQAPAAPTGLTASAGNKQVALAWTASSGATSYNVYRGKTSGGESATPIATGITTTSFTNTGLGNGKTFYFKVAAVNGAGTSALSSEVSATPHSSSAAPSAPVGLTATAAKRKVTLSWTASSGATSYDIYRGTAAGAESATPIATGITGTSYTATGLNTGKPYFFKVAAVNTSGTSPLSNEASATPK